ncbi:MAG: hypothetical protein ACD_75C02006G0001 [uncultured bacterium]|nr:MAG: hypothetical protein ACD_75C02006G0001 [uncultured bacterium]HBG21533.1 hypothetical protein [Desulfobulbaceae bacterium]
MNLKTNNRICQAKNKMETGEAGKTWLKFLRRDKPAKVGRRMDAAELVGFVKWGKNGDPVVMPLLGTTGFSD